MPNTELNIEYVRSHVLKRLGASSIDVELLADDIDEAGRQALRVLNRYRPIIGEAQLRVAKAQHRYPIAINRPGLIGVYDIHFITSFTEFGTLFDPFFTSPFGVTNLPNGSYATLMMELTYIKDARRITSNDPDGKFAWIINPQTKRPEANLFINIPFDPTLCGFSYTWGVDYNDSPEVGLMNVSSDDVDWFLNFTVARAKFTLARILGKFGGIPTSEGGTDGTDAESLRQEAIQDEAQLTEDIRRRRRQLPPITA